MKGENLRRSAFLNSLTGLIDYFAKIGVGFFLNPVMVTFLGATHFGAWQVIGQLNSYMATADVRAATSLKYILSKFRSTSDEYELKKVVSAALYANLIFIPLYLVLGALIIWFAPILAGVPLEDFYVIRVATAFLVLSFLITQFFFLFESTLHGMNLAYKRIGIRATITVVSGAATAYILYRGYGIAGVAVVQVFTALFTGLSFWWIVAKVLPWFEFIRVKWDQILSFIKLSGWYMLLKLSDLLSQSIDMILLGALAGPTYVAAYAMTKYLMIAVAGVVRTVSTASSIGIAKFIGEKNFPMLIQGREQLLSIQWVFVIVGGALVCLLNESFINLWTEDEMFSGQWETFLIVLIALVTVLFQVDSGIVNSSLNVRTKIILTIISSLITIGLSFVLVPLFHTLGMLIAILVGLLFLAISNTFLVMRITGDSSVFGLYFSRVSVVGFLIILASNLFGPKVGLDNWFSFFAVAAAAGIFIFIVVWFLALSKTDRLKIIDNFKKIRK